MNTRPLLNLAVATTILTFGHLANLNASITLSPTKPTNDVILTNTEPAASGSTQLSRGGNNQFGGIAFTLESAIKLDAVTFYLHAFGTGAQNAAVSFSVVKFAELPTVPTPNPTTDEVYTYTSEYSESMTLPGTLTADNYITFSFSAPVSLNAGTYGILFEFENAGSSQSINLRTVETNYTLADVVNFRTAVPATGDPTYYVSEREIYFSLHGVPEPSTALLTVAGILLTTGILKRRLPARAK